MQNFQQRHDGLLMLSVGNVIADQAGQEHPALSAAQRSSGVASTSQPSRQQDSPHGSSQHLKETQQGPSQHSHGVTGGKHGHHARQQGLDPGATHGGQAGASRLPSQSRELEELFAVLSSWLSLGESRHGLPLWER